MVRKAYLLINFTPLLKFRWTIPDNWKEKIAVLKRCRVWHTQYIDRNFTQSFQQCIATSLPIRKTLLLSSASWLVQLSLVAAPLLQDHGSTVVTQSFSLSLAGHFVVIDFQFLEHFHTKIVVIIKSSGKEIWRCTVCVEIATEQPNVRFIGFSFIKLKKNLITTILMSSHTRMSKPWSSYSFISYMDE